MIRATSTHVIACLSTLASSRLAPVSAVTWHGPVPGTDHPCTSRWSLTRGSRSEHDRLDVRFSVREQARILPVRPPAVARQGASELDAVPLRAGPGGSRARPRHGTRPGRVQQLPRSAPADGVLRTAARPRAPAAHRLGDRTGSSALSAPLGDDHPRPCNPPTTSPATCARWRTRRPPAARTRTPCDRRRVLGADHPDALTSTSKPSLS